MNLFKKVLSLVMSFYTLLIMSIGKINAMQNQTPINILVVCQDEDILNNFFDYVKNKEYIFSKQKVVESTKGYPSIIYSDFEKKVNLVPCHFDKKHKYDIPELKNICQMIILYDISDKNLDYIVENYANIESSEWEDLLNKPTFLNDCINLSIGVNWFCSFNFFSYDKSGSLSKEERENRREKLNYYTCSLEHKLDIDNRWGRGHADYLNCQQAFLVVLLVT